MNGIEFFSAARASKAHNRQPALLFASTHDKEVVGRAIEAGITECFSKRQLPQLEQFVEVYSLTNKSRLTGNALLVEDSRSAAHLLREVLTRLGLYVDTCDSAEAAIAQFDRKHYDLIVTDYMLSGTATGFAIIRAVRGTPGRKGSTPILVISSFDDPSRRVEALRNGASDFVSKPVVAEELEVRVIHLVTLQNMMRQLESQHEAMRVMAMHDQLTSLYNRYFLETKSAGLIETARTKGDPLSLLVVDIDHFKRINDTHGHKAGDHVLEATAAMMQRFARHDDVVARVGGEEFVILMPQVDLGNAIERADELRQLIAAQRPGDIDVTVSIGATTLGDGDTYDDLFRRADTAAYRAKEAGRNRVEVMAGAAPILQ